MEMSIVAARSFKLAHANRSSFEVTISLKRNTTIHPYGKVTTSDLGH